MRLSNLLVSAFVHGVVASCTLTHTQELGCHFSTWGLNCPGGQLVSYGKCGWWSKSRKCVTERCCAGYAGSNCDQPVCGSGCGHGSCTSPGTCTCQAGYGGATCSHPICVGGCGHGSCTAPGKCTCNRGYAGASCSEPAAGLPELTVLSVNFACRDVAHLAGCDNCKTRFDLIARALRGSTGFAGVPDLDKVDVVLAQELGTSPAKFAQVTDALAARGFVHHTGTPAPTAADPQCSNPPGPLLGSTAKAAFSTLSGLESGGLVTFSKHPILSTARQNWCAHNLPAPAGYLATLLSVGGTSALVVNLHAFPEYDFGIEAADVRTYQFSELSAFASAAEAALRAAGTPFAVILGGDFNEDAYGLGSTSGGRRCDALAAEAVAKLEAVNLDLRAACTLGAIGSPTWSPSTNDLTARFSSGGTHEVLDYLVMHSSSAPAAPAATNRVATLKAENAWSGNFCKSSILGTVGETYRADANALTDHNTVSATFTLPESAADRASSSSAAAAAFETMLHSWRSDAGAQEAACGQAGAPCVADTNCCEARFSWSGVEHQCDASFTCVPCVPLGGSCGSSILHPQGSPCCGYDEYGSAGGAHCDMTPSGPICVPKYDAGEGCVWDEECKSRSCKAQLWPPGTYCA